MNDRAAGKDSQVPQAEVEPVKPMEALLACVKEAEHLIKSKFERHQKKLVDMDSVWGDLTETDRKREEELKDAWVVTADGEKDKYDSFVNQWLLKHTGANTEKWVSRLREFHDNPERRAVMLRKLIKKGEDMLHPEGLEDDEMKLGTLGLMETCYPYDETGLKCYFYTGLEKRGEKGGRAELGITVFPIGISFSEVPIDPVLPDGTKSWRSMDFVSKVARKNDTKFHYIQTPVLYQSLDSKTIEEVPVLGRYKDGKLLKPFMNKDPLRATNEWDSGGVIMENGGYEIEPLATIVAAAKSGRDVDQCLFAVNQDNWQEVMSNPVYKNTFLNGSVMGYFIRTDGEKQYFSAELGISQNYPLQNSLYEIDRISQQMANVGWRAVYLDCGGSFSGMKIIGPKGQTNCGSSTYNQRDFGDMAHGHYRFYEYSWPIKPNGV